MHVRTGQKYFPDFARNNPDLLLSDFDITYMNTILKRAVAKYNVPNREIDYKFREGSIFREIVNQAYYDDSNLIVIGTHGVSGFEDRWVGSNAYRLAANAPCPILTVRKDMVIHEERKIMLPIDHSKLSRRIASKVVEFAKIIGAKVFLVGVNENNRWFLPGRLGMFVRQVERHIRKEQVPVETIIIEDAITKPQQILKYAEKNHITFIALPVRKSITPFESFFFPYANELLNISEIPVLVVPETNY